MRKKIHLVFKLCMLALCAGFFVIPARATELLPDTTPPVIQLAINYDTLVVTVEDAHSGVAVIYVDDDAFAGEKGTTLQIPLKSYSQAQQIVIAAIDYAGNKTNNAVVSNPFYNGAATVSKLQNSLAAPASMVTLSEGAGEDDTPPVITQTGENGNSLTLPETTKKPDGTSLTPDGTGSILDSIPDASGKEFLTLETPDGYIYYLVIDRTKDSENVYLLDTVKERDLVPLADDKSSQNQGGFFPSNGNNDGTDTSNTNVKQPTDSNTTKQKNGANLPFVAVVAIIAFGAAYYIKIVKPKRDAAEKQEAVESEYDDIFDREDTQMTEEDYPSLEEFEEEGEEIDAQTTV